MNTKLSIFTTSAAGHRIYILIAVPIVLFNLIAVFGLDVLLADDASRYYRIAEGTFVLKFIHLAIGWITLGISLNIMRLSPDLIRAIYVLFVMVPLSCLIYNLLHKKMGFPKIAAYFAAVLPNILPGQYLIPAFINGSHVSIGLIAVLSCFFASFRYLESQLPKNWKMLLTAVFLYALATQLGDQPVFSLPVLLFAILGCNKFNRKHLFLAGSLFLVFLHKAAWMLLIPRDSTRMVVPTISKMLNRAGSYFSSMLPLPKFVKEFETLVGILFILIVITGLILYIKNRTPGFSRSKAFEHLSHKKFTFYVYGFLSLWVVSHIIVFITVSQRSFRVRYTYIAAYGLIALLVISLYQIVKIVFRQKEKLICTFFLIIILISGFSRFIELKSYFKSLNRNQAMIIKNLNRFQFPENSQIVIYLESGRNFWSDWFQSSGHLKYMLKRDDIDGLIGSKNGRYFNFYNPFDKETRGFGPNHWMKGINIQRPLFLFVEKNKKFKQYHYALQWKNNTSESQWTIFHFDKKTGKASSVLSGTGREDYDSALGRLKRTGITPKDILWGGQTVLQ